MGLGLFSWGGLDFLPYCVWEENFFGGSTCLKGCLLPSGTDQVYGSNLMEYIGIPVPRIVVGESYVVGNS